MPQCRGVFGMGPTATADHPRSEGDPLRRVLRVPLAGDTPVRTPTAFVVDVADIGICPDRKRGQFAQLPQRRGDDRRGGAVDEDLPREPADSPGPQHRSAFRR